MTTTKEATIPRPRDAGTANTTPGQHEPAEISTLNGERLTVTPDDPVFEAARSLFSEHGLGNVLFIGESGCGKTRRCEALTLPENYPVLLAGTPLEDIEVRVDFVEVDLIQITANAELHYESCLQNGTFSREAALVADFILGHGTTHREEFEENTRRNRETLHRGRGVYHLHLLVVDDFDRCYREVASGFMKLIHGNRHVLQKLPHDTHYLRIQCLATSNSGLGTPSGKYSGAAGKLDLAVANRFNVLHLGDPPFETILARSFPSERDFCRTLAEIVGEIKSRQAEGELEELGEVSLRQMLPIVEAKTRFGLCEEAAATRLFSALPTTGESRSQADLILARRFGRRIRRDEFEFPF